MTGAEVAITALGKANEITKEHQKGFIHFVLVTFFGGTYFKFLSNSLVLEGAAKIDAERKLSLIEANPRPALELMQSSEAEIEYRNMFGVLEKTIPLIQDSNNEEKQIDPDKMKRLKDLSKEFSSNDMQDVIAGILAGEYNQPGSFSLRTMDIVRHLSKEEITLFSRFLGLVFMRDAIPESFFNDDLNFKQSNISFNNLLELSALGLISLQSSQRVAQGKDGNLLQIYIGGKEYWFKYTGNGILKIDGIYQLTKSGKEISRLLTPIFNEYCFEFICRFLSPKGLTLDTSKSE